MRKVASFRPSEVIIAATSESRDYEQCDDRDCDNNIHQLLPEIPGGVVIFVRGIEKQHYMSGGPHLSRSQSRVPQASRNWETCKPGNEQGRPRNPWRAPPHPGGGRVAPVPRFWGPGGRGGQPTPGKRNSGDRPSRVSRFAIMRMNRNRPRQCPPSAGICISGGRNHAGPWPLQGPPLSRPQAMSGIGAKSPTELYYKCSQISPQVQ